MTTIYDSEHLRVTLSDDGYYVEFWNFDECVITMTAQEFGGIWRGWRAMVSPVTSLVAKLEGEECFTKLAEDIISKVYEQAEGKRVIVERD